MHNLILECVHACMWKEVSVSKRSACPKACLLPNSAPCVELYVQNLVLLVTLEHRARPVHITTSIWRYNYQAYGFFSCFALFYP
jgi:hypothetical protein